MGGRDGFNATKRYDRPCQVLKSPQTQIINGAVVTLQPEQERYLDQHHYTQCSKWLEKRIRISNSTIVINRSADTQGHHNSMGSFRR